MKGHYLLDLLTAIAFINAAYPQFVYAQTSNSGQTNGQVSTAPGAPISAPSNTVGNTPSSVRTGAQNSGYSAGGSTVNTNINNTQVGNRSAGQPIGAGSNTSRSYGSR
jgi:hypothetical protein